MNAWFLRNRNEIIGFLKLSGLVHGMSWLMLIAAGLAVGAEPAWKVVVVSTVLILSAAIISFYCFLLSTITFKVET